MPQIKIEKIISFSSEDPSHPANNILLSDPAKKWKCQNVGEKCSTVILQLERACNISKIDIGNEHSAYIEVLVSRSTSPEDYKVLVLMSSFMSPLDARQSQNVNKVRMFTKNDLSEPERDEKWDRIKIVCTQPFNRHVQYGLSFINFYTNEAANSDKLESKKPSENLSFGKFTVRPESPDTFVPGSLFSKRKELSLDPPVLKGAAAIREAQSLAQISSPLAKKIKQTLATPGKTPRNVSSSEKNSDQTESPKQRNRNELLYNEDEEEKNEKIDRNIEKKLKEKEKLQREKEDKIKKEKEDEKRKRDEEKRKRDEEKRKKDREEAKTPNKAENKDRDKPKEQNKKINTSLNQDKPRNPVNTHKRKTENASSAERPKPKKAKITRPFEKLLENVVLVISGIQNPERASLRSMALSMGAKYKPDWDNRCTHLICAFANTPKFNQVKGKGKIVKKSWIDDCYNARKRLPWRRYALDKADIGPESEEEIWEKEDTPPPSPSPTPPAQTNDSGSDTDTDAHLRDDGSDTEERVRKIQENLLNQSKNGTKHQKNKSPPIIDKPKEPYGDIVVTKTDVYSVDTDSESEQFDSKITKDLRFIENNLLEDFFADKLFYVDNVFDKDFRRKLRQYIVAYKGVVVDELDTSVEIIVTTKDNSPFLKDLFPSAVCVAPDWIWKCHNSGKCVPTHNYAF